MKEKKENNKNFVFVHDHFLHSGILSILWHNEDIVFKDIKERKFDRAEFSLLSNASWNLKYCIEFAKYFLALSSKDNVKKCTNKKPEHFENIDRYEDFIHAKEHRFLLPSILFYNASFDYLCIFIYSLLTERKDIIKSEETKIEKILQEMDYLNLSNEKYSWIFALNSLITRSRPIRRQLVKKFKIFFCEDFIKKLDELILENKKIRKNYYANMLKHQQIPFFKPKCLDNVGGAKYFININQFYSMKENIPSIHFAIPETVFDIDETQKFLIKYHNITVKVFNCLLSKINIDKREQRK